MSEAKPRICIIGGGPTGMCALYHLKLIAGDTVDINIYEKQDNWRGLWHYTWRTGTDEYGETIPNTMYKNLWTINPKEILECNDYFFEEHFGKELPSYIPREIFAEYLDGRWTKGKCGDLTGFVDFRHVVQNVEYSDENDNFTVVVRDLRQKTAKSEIFSHIIVATGNFSVANIPEFPGIDTFPGNILHSKDFRNALAFKDKSVLIIGGSFSASEIALQFLKYKCSSRVVISSRNATIQTNIVEGFDVRLLPERIDANQITFKDGSSATFDVIIFCTGYIYYFPFLNGNLRFDIEGKRSTLYPPNLYKGSMWLKGGNNKLFHIGAYVTYFNMPVYDAQATWIANYILRKIPGQQLLSSDEMKQEADKWWQKASVIADPWSTIEFMRDFMKYLCNDIEYESEYADKIHALVKRALTSRMTDVCGYRDECYPNMYTGKVPPTHHTKWIDCLDESIDFYLN